MTCKYSYVIFEVFDPGHLRPWHVNIVTLFLRFLSRAFKTVTCKYSYVIFDVFDPGHLRPWHVNIVTLFFRILIPVI